MGKGRKKGARKPQGRYISSAEELHARNEQDVKDGKPVVGGIAEDGAVAATVTEEVEAVEAEDGHNSDLDFLSDDDLLASRPVVPVFEKEKPLTPQQLIETQNMNVKKGSKNLKAKDLAEAAPQQLTRREREFMEAQEAERERRRLTALGLTDEAKADLARLAEIREKREAVKRQRAEEQARKAKLAEDTANRLKEMQIAKSSKGKGKGKGKKKG